MAIPQIPLVNKGQLYITGMQMNWLTTTTIGISSGQCRDSTNTNDINMTTTGGVVINVRSNGANGLDTGVLAPNQFYFVFAIGNSASNDTSLVASAIQPVPPIQPPVTITASTGGLFQPALGLISLNPSTPLLPSGFDMFRRVGVIVTDGTAAPNTLVLKFSQIGNNSERWMYYDAPIVALAAIAKAAFTPLDLNVTNLCVPIVPTSVSFDADLLPNAPADFVALQPGSSTNATGYYARMSGSVAAVHKFGNLICPCSNVGGNPTINYVTDAASTVALNVTGYLDLL